MSAAQMPCPGVKGHGIQNVPGVWYDLSSRIDEVQAVLYWIGETLPSLDGMSERQAEYINRAASLASAARTLAELCGKDVNDLEQQLKTP